MRPRRAANTLTWLRTLKPQYITCLPMHQGTTYKIVPGNGLSVVDKT